MSALSFRLLIFLVFTASFSVAQTENIRDTKIYDIYRKIIQPKPDELDLQYSDREVPAWNQNVEYYAGDLVLFESEQYKCLEDSFGEAPKGSKKWMKFPRWVTISFDSTSVPLFWAVNELFDALKEDLTKAKISSENRFITYPFVRFINCNSRYLLLRFLEIEGELRFYNSKFGSLHLENTKVKKLWYSSSARFFMIDDSGIENSEVNSDNSNGNLVIVNSNFLELKLQIAGDFNLRASVVGRDFSLSSESEVKSVQIEKCTLGSPVDSGLFRVSANIRDFLMDSTVVNSSIALCKSSFRERFQISHSEIRNKVAIHNALFPENLKMRWSQLRPFSISKFFEFPAFDRTLGFVRVHSSFIPSDSEGIANTDHFEDIISSYQTLLSFYRKVGDIESANACFVEMKDVQLKRLAFQYTLEPSFRNWISWRLGQLMKGYSEHGTDPSKAIVVSVWVIFLFAIFYFFFPSDWDVTSKAKLIQNFKDFIEKNDKGYWKPFFFLLLGFVVSLVNAVTLSINSFTTLGFGNIPTHGIAKYFCVIQGFLGWFLLSIFTVALINQVMS